MLVLLIFHFINILAAQNNPQKVESQIDSPISDTKFCGLSTFDPENERQDYTRYIFSLSQKNTVYFSEDNGKSIVDITQKLIQEQRKLQPTEAQYDGKILKIIVSKYDQQTIYLLGMTDISFYSNNCGYSFTAFKHHIGMTSLEPSANSNHLLGLSLIMCQEGKTDCPHLYDLYISQDNGRNWEIMKQWVSQAQWDMRENSTQVHKNMFVFLQESSDRILVSGFVHPQNITCDWELITKEQCKIQVEYSDDFFKTTHLMVQDAIQYHRTEHYIFALLQRQNNLELHISSVFYGKNNYHFIPIKITEQKLRDHGFTILEAKHGVIVLNINHIGEEASYGNVYVSDYQGIKFSLSLENNARDSNGYTDFIRIQSLDGVYIANQVINGQKKSVISFNQGSQWHPIEAPKVDSSGNVLNCQGCSLHLVGFVDFAGTSIHSDKDAKGVIMALGNVGNYLDTKNINTYLSIDGGNTWKEIKKGSHVFELGDHAGIIVMAKNDQPTDEIIFSWDFGLNWESIKISSQKLNISSIIIDKDVLTQNFLIQGEMQDSKGQQIFLDFNSINERVCKGHQTPNKQDSDYETWSPFKTGCVMGQKVYVIRRKQTARCWNDQQAEHKNFLKSCSCTEEDWECEFGYIRGNEGKCVPVDQKYQIQNVKPEICLDWYFVQNGYRKIPGNMCNGGAQKLPCDPNKEKNQIEQEVKQRLEDGLRKSITLQVQKQADKKIENMKKQLEPQIEYPKKVEKIKNYFDDAFKMQKQQQKQSFKPIRVVKPDDENDYQNYWIIALLFISVAATIFLFKNKILDFISKPKNNQNQQNSYYEYQGLQTYN